MCPFEFCRGPVAERYRLSAFAVMECRRCGVRFRDPLPSREEMDEMYADPAYHSAGYFADQLSAQPQVSLPERGIYRDLLAMIPARASHDRLLDVGCGAGLFVRMALDAGWQAEGLELSSELSALARAQHGIAVHDDDFLEWSPAQAGYRLITMWDFLEHVPDPLAAVRKAADLLAPQGMLAVLTIDSTSLFNALGDLLYRAASVRRPLDLLYDRRHAFYFGRADLRRLIEAGALTVQDERHYRAYLGRWLSMEVPAWLRAGGDLVDWCSVPLQRQYRQLLVARKAG